MIAHQVYIPGISPPVLEIDVGDSQYRLLIPGVWDCLAAASNYRWNLLIPGCLTDESRDEIEDDIADPDHPLTQFRLHVVMQRVGLYLYGWPYFTASRAWSTAEHYWSYFRVWMMRNCNLPPQSAADWVGLSVAFLLEGAETKEERNTRWAKLVLPNSLPDDAPGIVPDWMDK